MFRSSQFCRNWHLSSLLLCQWNLRWVLKTSPASAGIVSWQSGELCCLLHLALQATWACWQSCWRQIMPHRGQMSLTVRARDWRPSKKIQTSHGSWINVLVSLPVSAYRSWAIMCDWVYFHNQSQNWMEEDNKRGAKLCLLWQEDLW